jgi:hypothetical protein
MVRDSRKVNDWCGFMKDRIIRRFFFVEDTVTGGVYLDVLEQFVCLQAADLQPNIIYQQDGAPPHWSLHVRETIMRTFPDRWIGRDGPISWPPRSPDITPLDLFFWEYVKDRVCATRLPDLPLRDRIRDVISSLTLDMLDRTWQEIEYRLDIIRATSGSHVEVY